MRPHSGAGFCSGRRDLFRAAYTVGRRTIMAFLAPLLPWLASAAPAVLGSIAAPIAKRIYKWATGKGVPRRAHRRQMRIKGGSLSIMNKWPLLERSHRYACGGRIGRGGSLAVMNKWPLLERDHRYATGGRLLRGGNLPIGPLNKWLIGRADHTAKGARGGAILPAGAFQRFARAIASATAPRGKGGRVHHGKHLVQYHLSHSARGRPELVRGHFAHNPKPHMVRGHQTRAHMAAGLLRGAGLPGRYRQAVPPRYTLAGMNKRVHNGYSTNPKLSPLFLRGAGGRVRRPAQPKLASVMRLPGMGGGTHLVRPHLSHTKYGAPVHVKGHYSAGMSMTHHKVRPHVRMTGSGPVRVRGHVRGGSLASDFSHRRTYGFGLLNPSGRGLLGPARR
jgi:hypothetical protein